MAHYALLDDNNVVVRVFVGIDESNDNIDWEHHYGAFHKMTCKRTSYNTAGNRHRTGGNPYRKNFAASGFVYDEERDAFIPPKPYDSYVLNEERCIWDAPIEKPELSEEQYSMQGMYIWDEDLWQSDNTKGWVYKELSSDPKIEEPPTEDLSIEDPEEEDPPTVSDFSPMRNSGVVGYPMNSPVAGSPEPPAESTPPPSL